VGPVALASLSGGLDFLFSSWIKALWSSGLAGIDSGFSACLEKLDRSMEGTTSGAIKGGAVSIGAFRSEATGACSIGACSIGACSGGEVKDFSEMGS